MLISDRRTMGCNRFDHRRETHGLAAVFEIMPLITEEARFCLELIEVLNDECGFFVMGLSLIYHSVF
jgi:hypothetical protein